MSVPYVPPFHLHELLLSCDVIDARPLLTCYELRSFGKDFGPCFSVREWFRKGDQRLSHIGSTVSYEVLGC